MFEPIIDGERRTVRVGAHTTAYWVYGPQDAKITIIAVHGFRGDHHGLERIVSFLPEYRVISPDLPGFGETAPLNTEQDLDTYTSWLTAFANEVAPHSVILGHSFGSIVAAAAVSHGLSTPRLILVNPIGAPALKGPKGLLTRLAVFYYWLGAKLPERLGTALLRNRFIVRIMSIAMVKTKNPELRAFVHHQHDLYFSRFTDRDALLGAFRTSVTNDVSSFAAGIIVPTLLVAAEKDDITPIAVERELVKRFPQADLVEIPRVGHLIHYETPEVAADAIRVFLNSAQARD